MAPFAYADVALSVMSTARLTGSGFTEAQAETVVEVVHSTVSDAIETLRHEFACWHAYLALYVLAQIGIALLVVLLVQATRAPELRPFAGEFTEWTMPREGVAALGTRYHLQSDAIAWRQTWRLNPQRRGGTVGHVPSRCSSGSFISDRTHGQERLGQASKTVVHVL
ncbi:hypothetical protein [Methylobacterium sp.]|uniref:hypothetical protein n=1 Tax=Methylobacterium sp. TaxID=409 RepID=UPI0015C968B9|nr:hypothetical protein [Methylobacterium sp.]